jgi:hypothetical protein
LYSDFQRFAKPDAMFPAPAAFGTLRPGHRRHHGAEVEFERVGEDRVGEPVSRNMPCAFE